MKPSSSYKKGAGKRGVSPVIATTIIIAITVTLGLALYAFTNSQSNVATKSFADEATDYINYRNDRFVVTALGFKTDDCDPASSSCVTAYVFNNGNLPVNITKVLVGTSEKSKTPIPVATPDGFVMVQPKNIGSVPFDGPSFPSNPGDSIVYYVTLQSNAGSYQTYFQSYQVPAAGT